MTSKTANSLVVILGATIKSFVVLGTTIKFFFLFVGVTNQINETNLYDLAGDTGNVFESETFENLGQRVSNVLTASNVCPPDPGKSA